MNIQVRARARRWWVRVVVTLVACALAAVGVQLQIQRRHLVTEQNAYTSEKAAAQQVANLLLGLNASSAPGSLTKLKKLATGDFGRQVTQLAAVVSELLKEGEVSSAGKVTAVGVASEGGTRASVLVSAVAVVTNTAVRQGAWRTYRMIVDLTHTDSGWKASNVEFLS